MQSKRDISKDSLTGLYYEYKELVVPVFAIVVSVLLIFIFILPQVLSFPEGKTQVDAEMEKLNKIKESEKILSTVNVDLLNSQVEIAAKTLPQTKQFENVLNAISSAANISSTQIDSYNYKDTSVTENSTEKFSSLFFDISIFGDPDQIVNFINQLYKTFPLSDVTNITSSEGLSSVTVLFYYNPFTNAEIGDRTLVRSMSDREKKVLDEISKWDEPSSGDIFNLIPASTSSAETGSPF